MAPLLPRFLLPLAFACAAAFAQSPHDPVPDLAVGKRVFESQCALCHGQGGTGGRGPSLARPKLAKAADDEALLKVIVSGLPPEMPGAWQLSIRELASVAAYVRSLGALPPETLPGDAERGAAVYRAKGCANCHIVDGVGAAHGPELSAVGARRHSAHLRESLLKPEAFLPEGFLLMEVTTSDGGVVRGTRDNEDPFTLQLATLDGARHSWRKSELRSIRRLAGESTMPSFAKALSAAELDDLVAYLAARKDSK